MARIVSRSEFDSLLPPSGDSRSLQVQRSAAGLSAGDFAARSLPAAATNSLPNNAAGLQAVVNALATALARKIVELTGLNEFQLVASEARIETGPERWVMRPLETQVLFEASGAVATVILALPDATREWLIDRMLGSTLDSPGMRPGRPSELDRRLEQLVLNAFASELSCNLPNVASTTSWTVIRLPETTRPVELLAAEPELLVSDLMAVDSPHWLPIRLGMSGSLVGQLLSSRRVPSGTEASSPPSLSDWLTVEVGRSQLTIEELETLAVGDVLLTDRKLEAAFRCQWNERPVFEAIADEDPHVRAIRILRDWRALPAGTHSDASSASP